MKAFRFLPLFACFLFIVGCTSSTTEIKTGPGPGETWRAVHFLGYETDRELRELEKTIPKLAEMGVNTVIFEIDYNFNFNSHPELRRGASPITQKGSHRFAETCRKNGIRIIPEFQCVGHQSWEEETFPLLVEFPHFDLTPGAFPDNTGIYCREWDVLNPQVNSMIFELMDELIEAFNADAFHVGMDEVFLLGSEHSPSTKGKDPGELYAKAINDMYNHLVKGRGVEMLMWGDRLFDGKNFEFGRWESSLNGTASAIDMIPKDIIICPWHYEKMKAYPSLPIFIEKGFRVLPTSWRKVDATKELILYSQKLKNPKMLGHLFTSWGKTDWLKYQPLEEGLKLLLDK
ncbi:MAG: family 20 glycosylhydrolase [Candidatus Aminicenantes bacterium]|nr:MAG: family 20 glycosylhydrolase [Candidatus Aminicenantes bacterium]